MESLSADLSRVASAPAATTVLMELAAVLVALGVAWLASRWTRRWEAARPKPVPGMPTVVREAIVLAIPYLAALGFLLVLRGVLALRRIDTAFLDQVLVLLGVLIAIRGGVFMFRMSVGPESRFRIWEARVAVLVWFFVAMHILGWLDAVIGVLDRVPVVPASKGQAALTLWSIIRSLFTVIAFVIVSAWVGRWLERRITRVQGLAPSTRIAVSKFTYAFLIGFGVLLGLSASGLNLGALSIFGGALGLGLGFGLQAIAANFVSGFVLLMDKSIKPGDVISFTGTLGTSTEGFGWVQELRGRYVVVRDRDGVETLVPNQNLITNQVINWSYSDRRVRLKLPVRISYDDDPEQAMAVLLKAAEGQRRILRDPPPVARLMAFNDYGMDLELRFWIADPQEGVNNVRSDVNRAIYRLFREHGITIPRAQLDVRMYDADGKIVGGLALPVRPPGPPPPPPPPPLGAPTTNPTGTRPFGL